MTVEPPQGLPPSVLDRWKSLHPTVQLHIRILHGDIQRYKNEVQYQDRMVDRYKKVYHFLLGLVFTRKLRPTKKMTPDDFAAWSTLPL